MAQLVMTFDTIEKTLVVTMDGTPIENVVEVCAGQSYEDPRDFRCSVLTSIEDETTDIHTYTRMVASEQGLVEEKPDLKKAIASYLGCEEG